MAKEYQFVISELATPAELQLEGQKYGKFMAEQTIGIMNEHMDKFTDPATEAEASGLMKKGVAKDISGTVASVRSHFGDRAAEAFEREVTKTYDKLIRQQARRCEVH